MASVPHREKMTAVFGEGGEEDPAGCLTHPDRLVSLVRTGSDTQPGMEPNKKGALGAPFAKIQPALAQTPPVAGLVSWGFSSPSCSSPWYLDGHLTSNRSA